LVYLIAATTGLRRKELGALKWDDIDLDEQRVLVRASISKNSKSAVMPLVLDSLKEWKAYRDDPSSFFPHEVRGRARGYSMVRHKDGFALPPIPQAETLRADCEKCAIESDWTRARIDFHSLRVSFVTGLDEVGANIQKAQKLARHSDPRLTSNIYTKHGLAELSAEVNKLGAKIKRRQA
jgi:integrase